MSTRVVQVCDVPKSGRNGGACGQEATQTLDVKIGKANYAADVCEDHMANVEKAFASIGITLTSAKSADAKKVKAMKTASNKAFTAADARAWLIENELLSPDHRGRVKRDLLDQYAAAH